MSIIAFAKTQIRDRFAKLLHYYPGALKGKDSEQVHKMRVYARRLHAVLETFEELYTKKSYALCEDRLEDILDELNEIRNLEVQRESLLTYEKKIPLSRRAGLQPLVDFFNVELEKRRAVLPVSLKTLLDRPFRTSILGFRRDADASRLERSIAKTMTRRTDRVTHRHQALEKKFTATTLHRYRIGCKKLRYVLEVVVALDGKKEDKILKALVSIQELLGTNQDLVVHLGYLKKVPKTEELRRLKHVKQAEQGRVLKKIRTRLGI